MALKEEYVTQMPEAQRIFDFLERHYPKLVNAVENPLIPLTNNTVELVIRRFDQHYQNMCGFDSIETARKSCAGSCWAEHLKPSGSLSQMRNAPLGYHSRVWGSVAWLMSELPWQPLLFDSSRDII